MKIIERHEHRFRMRVECQDDLWYLAKLCLENRFFGMLGARRDQTTGGQEGERAKSAERKKAWIKLKIEHAEFQTFGDNLRIHGIIEEAPFDKGLHHTHLVETGDEFELESDGGFLLHDIDLIERSVSSSGRANVAILVVEHDEISLYEVTGRGMREVTYWSMRGGGKYHGIKQLDSIHLAFFNKAAKECNELIDSSIPMVICGPGHSREKISGSLHHETKRLVATSIGGRSAANEILSKNLGGDLLKEHAIVTETALLEEAWRRMATGGAVTYGKESLHACLDSGNIETFLITADLLREDEEWIQFVNGLDEIGAKFVQCSSDHDAGQQLIGMGGAVALLRYKVE